MTNSLITYHVATTHPTQPPSRVFEYWFAQNGVFAHAQRPGLHVLLPISVHTQPIKGLVALTPFVKLRPRVPEMLMQRMLTLANHELPNEVLFHLVLRNDQWQLITPEQIQSPQSCTPALTELGSSTQSALIEIHSHGTMPAYFSQTDDQDECNGFRIYGVLGKLHSYNPELLLRVGLFGHAYTIPASLIFTSFDGVQDLNQTQGCVYYAMQGNSTTQL